MLPLSSYAYLPTSPFFPYSVRFLDFQESKKRTNPFFRFSEEKKKKPKKSRKPQQLPSGNYIDVFSWKRKRAVSHFQQLRKIATPTCEVHNSYAVYTVTELCGFLYAITGRHFVSHGLIVHRCTCVVLIFRVFFVSFCREKTRSNVDQKEANVLRWLRRYVFVH